MYNYIKHETDIFGLTFRPELTQIDNDQDFCDSARHPYRPKLEITDRNLTLLETALENSKGGNVLEIGVARNPDFSRCFTSVFFKYPEKFKYLGVDIEDRSHIKQHNPKANFIQTDSSNFYAIRQKMVSCEMGRLEVLLIDGWHSMNAVIKDWHYAKLVQKGGVVILHDTNHHPGPKVLLECIDPNIFKIDIYFRKNLDDNGMAILKRL